MNKICAFICMQCFEQNYKLIDYSIWINCGRPYASANLIERLFLRCFVIENSKEMKAKKIHSFERITMSNMIYLSRNWSAE